MDKKMILKINKYIAFIIFLLTSSVSFCQEIECDTLKFSLQPSKMVSLETSGLKVEGILNVKGLVNDTLVLITEVETGDFLGPKNVKASMINEDGTVQNLQVWVQQNDNGSQQSIYLMPCPKDAKIQFSYYLFGSSLIGGDDDTFAAYLYHREKFYPKNMHIRNISVITDEEFNLYTSDKKSNDEIQDISLIFIQEEEYDKKIIDKANCKVTIFVPDSLSTDDKMLAKINILQQQIENLQRYISAPVLSTVFFTNWRNDNERFCFGQAVGDYVVCDINFDGQSLLHEILHNLLPSNVEKNTKGQYFIGESIIEWLSLYLSNQKPFRRGDNLDNELTIYNVQVNNYKTFNIVYYIGPFIIQEVAAKYGEDKMAQCIISFLQEYKGKSVNYEDFIKYLTEYLSQESANELDHLVKTYH